MLYLKASTDIEILDQYKGEKGKFIKTFAFNSTRNNNGWRVTWDSIKKRIGSFIDYPGIEFVKCEGTVCDLDHTEGATYQQSLDIQEDFRVTDIIDYTLDENKEKSFFIHKLKPGHDDFYEKIQKGIIKQVSPSIWPIPGQFIIDGTNEKGLPIIDVFDWLPLHDAFLTKNAAYGDEATITATCEGENCHMKLLSAKELQGSSDGELSPLQEIPLLVRHKDKLRFVGVSKCVANKIYSKMKAGDILNEELLQSTIKELESKNSSQTNSDTSFSSCSCSAKLNSMTLTEDETKKLQDAAKASEEKVKELESKLKASEGLKKENDDLKAKLKASEDNKDEDIKEVKATSELLEKENKDLKAKIVTPMIAKILKAREERGMAKEMLDKLETSLKAKSLTDIEDKFNEDQFMMTSNNLTASENPKVHFDFGSGVEVNPSGQLSAKSLENTFDEDGGQS